MEGRTVSLRERQLRPSDQWPDLFSAWAGYPDRRRTFLRRLGASPPTKAPGLHSLGRIEYSGGHAYVTRLSDGVASGDSLDDPERSRSCLLENGLPLGPAHSELSIIAAEGLGRFAHWKSTLVFSSSDNSDPRVNGRDYSVYVPADGTTEKGRAIHILERLPEAFTQQDAYSAVERCLGILYPEARIGDDQKLFWRDERLLSAYKIMLSDNMRSYEPKFTVYHLTRALAHVAGDMAEIGTYTGATAYFMALAYQDGARHRPMHLFDSFEGLAAPGLEDGSKWQAGDLAATEATVRRNLAPFQGVHTYKGWVPDRFEEVSKHRFAFVHIDVDLYAPTKMAVEFFLPETRFGWDSVVR